MTLAQMRGMATAVPSKQMADLMRKITGCYEALEGVENSAMDAFVQVTGYVGKNLLPSGKEPPRYLKYSCDPLMDVARCVTSYALQRTACGTCIFH